MPATELECPYCYRPVLNPEIAACVCCGEIIPQEMLITAQRNGDIKPSPPDKKSV